MGKLDGKTVIVTGASRGIGAEIARLFAAEGGRVVAVARTLHEGDHQFEGSLDKTVEDIKAAGGEATGVAANISEPGECEKIVEAARSAYGPVDVLINNAALTYFLPVKDYPLNKWMRSWAVNFHAPFYLSQLVLQDMVAAKSGAIVNISSGAAIGPGRAPYEGDAALFLGGTCYGAEKAALERFSQGLAAEVFQYGISVTCFSPSLVVPTPGTVHHHLVKGLDDPNGEPPEFMAKAALVLATEPYDQVTGWVSYSQVILEKYGQIDKGKGIGFQRVGSGYSQIYGARVQSEKTPHGNFFEDFEVGSSIQHAVPRTVTDGDLALYIAVTGDRRPLHCAREFAQSLGYERETVHDMLVFHQVFGRAVPDVSLNSPANLGYADVRFLATVYSGDTLRAETKVIGKRETSRPDVGIVWVHTRGFNQRGETVLQFYRWAMVNKREPGVATGDDDAPELPPQVATEDLYVPKELDLARFDTVATGSNYFWEDYEPGERIVHPQGSTIEDAEHQMATRLYQNNARVHFNEMLQKSSKLGTRIIYGGHIISLCHSIANDGLENAIRILGFNAGAHANPTVGGDTLFAWTEVLERIDLGRDDCGALRLRLVGVKNLDPNQEDVTLRVKDPESGRENYHPNVVLDLDYTVLMPKKK